MIVVAVLVLIGFLILIMMYVLLTIEFMHRTAVAIFIAGIVFIVNIVFRFCSFEELFEGIDLDTILLLMNMMIIVGVLGKSGLFQYIALYLVSRFYRKPFKLLVLLMLFTAGVSAFIDNVTTILLVAPVIIEICRRLRVSPIPPLLCMVFSSNIGGTATLIGDPPNIIIGSTAKLGFMAFIYNLTPIVVIDMLLFIPLVKLLFRKWFIVYSERLVKHGESIRREFLNGSVRYDRELMRKTLAILFIVIALFFLEDILKYPPAVPAMIGAGLLLLFVRKRVCIEEVMEFIDWSTLVFFIAMFMIIRGIEFMGVLDCITNAIASTTTNYKLLLVIIAWFSAIVSAFVDNIPFVISMIPVIRSLALKLSVNATPLYWALSLGGCLGGNATMVGASANIVAVGLASRSGYHISFREFMKYGFPVMIATVAVASIYLVVMN